MRLRIFVTLLYPIRNYCVVYEIVNFNEDLAVIYEMSHTLNGDVQEDGSKSGIVNGHVDLFSKESLENAPTKSDRVIRKAKRPSNYTNGGNRRKSSESAEDETGPVKGNTRLPFSKNSKKSRGPRGRGNPKKGKFELS